MSSDNRNPIFRRVSGTRRIGQFFSFTGLIMEWWEEAKLRSVRIFLHDPPKELGSLQFRQLVFPAEQLPLKLDVSEFMLVKVEGKTYLPLEALVVALFETGRANRPFLEIMREYPHPEPTIPPPFEVPKEGLMVPALEDDGFSLFHCGSMADESKDALRDAAGRGFLPVAELAWWPHYKGLPVRAARAIFKPGDKLTAAWQQPASTDLAQMFTKELARRYPNALDAFTAKGLEEMHKSGEQRKKWKV